MKRIRNPGFGAIGSLLIAAVFPAAGGCLPDGTQQSGAKYRICVPNPGQWNGDLVVFAHGYVAFNEPIGIPEDQLTLPDGTSVPALVNALGYAFAVSSYSVNGLAVKEGIADLRDLVTIFSQTVTSPNRVLLAGPSEGGLVTALSIEQYPNIYSGGLAACGPVGDFPRQVNYIGDFRAVFDYFFPGLIPGAATSVPPSVIANWDAFYAPRIKFAIKAKLAATAQLLSVTSASVGADPATVEETVLSLLWYAVFSTNDATTKLGGQPFDNRTRYYSGSLNDFALNLGVQRYSPDPGAVAEMKAGYNTTGGYVRPLVTLHTLGDQIIPYWHEPLYSLKSLLAGSPVHVNVPVLRYGHCNFNVAEVLAAFVILVQQVSGEELAAAERVLPSADSRRRFREILEQARGR